MELIPTLITATVLAVFGSVTTYLTNRWIDGWRKKDAYKRLVAEPTIHVGARLTRVVDSSSGVQLMGPCEIVSLEVGRVVLRSADKKEMLPLGGRELEKLHPFADLMKQT
ncbi:MAG: hypothetical protein OXI69_15440 [Acidobacteriota bacterium]|nr:hypothetical protein [Acidobacteriota bacterium]